MFESMDNQTNKSISRLRSDYFTILLSCNVERMNLDLELIGVDTMSFWFLFCGLDCMRLDAEKQEQRSNVLLLLFVGCWGLILMIIFSSRRFEGRLTLVD